MVYPIIIPYQEEIIHLISSKIFEMFFGFNLHYCLIHGIGILSVEELMHRCCICKLSIQISIPNGDHCIQDLSSLITFCLFPKYFQTIAFPVCLAFCFQVNESLIKFIMNYNGWNGNVWK